MKVELPPDVGKGGEDEGEGDQEGEEQTEISQEISAKKPPDVVGGKTVLLKCAMPGSGRRGRNSKMAWVTVVVRILNLSEKPWSRIGSFCLFCVERRARWTLVGWKEKDRSALSCPVLSCPGSYSTLLPVG